MASTLTVFFISFLLTPPLFSSFPFFALFLVGDCLMVEVLRSIALFSCLWILHANSQSFFSCLVLACSLSWSVSMLRVERVQSVEGEQVEVVIVPTGDGLAMTTCLPGVTGCLLIGLKWVNSLSIELQRSLLQLLGSGGCLVAEGGVGVVGRGWNKE